MQPGPADGGVAVDEHPTYICKIPSAAETPTTILKDIWAYGGDGAPAAGRMKLGDTWCNG